MGFDIFRVSFEELVAVFPLICITPLPFDLSAATASPNVLKGLALVPRSIPTKAKSTHATLRFVGREKVPVNEASSMFQP